MEPAPERRTFTAAARTSVRDSQLRSNLRRATTTIRMRRGAAVAELPHWQALRAHGAQVKDDALSRLSELLVQLESEVVARGGRVHWARDAAEANRIVLELVTETGEREVVKVKSMLTQEIGLNAALDAAGISVQETDLAELIVQLAGDEPSHILVPAIHRNRSEIAQLFRERLPGAADVRDTPAALSAAARRHLRSRFLSARVAISGVNFMVAETGGMVLVESEGNGRMCVTLPDTLITVAGIEKVVPRWEDLATYLQTLPRSATGERMNPYTSVWTGLTDGDGPRHFHLVLVDNGRSRTLADPVGRQVLRCIRCSACLNVCPVYERAGGHAYGSVYPGPLGAVLTPQLRGVGDPAGDSLPFASTLCGACQDVCPVAIDIPRVLVYLRSRVEEEGRVGAEQLAMRVAARGLRRPVRWEAVQRLAARAARSDLLVGAAAVLIPALRVWTSARDLPEVPRSGFREWWAGRAS
jgi:L-lactate dehydrogenase complex protein LldF